MYDDDRDHASGTPRHEREVQLHQPGSVAERGLTRVNYQDAANILAEPLQPARVQFPYQPQRSTDFRENGVVLAVVCVNTDLDPFDKRASRVAHEESVESPVP